MVVFVIIDNKIKIARLIDVDEMVHRRRVDVGGKILKLPQSLIFKKIKMAKLMLDHIKKMTSVAAPVRKTTVDIKDELQESVG